MATRIPANGDRTITGYRPAAERYLEIQIDLRADLSMRRPYYLTNLFNGRHNDGQIEDHTHLVLFISVRPTVAFR